MKEPRESFSAKMPPTSSLTFHTGAASQGQSETSWLLCPLLPHSKPRFPEEASLTPPSLPWHLWLLQAPNVSDDFSGESKPQTSFCPKVKNMFPYSSPTFTSSNFVSHQVSPFLHGFLPLYCQGTIVWEYMYMEVDTLHTLIPLFPSLTVDKFALMELNRKPI